MLPADDAATPHPEEDRRRIVAVPGEPHDIRVPGAHHFDAGGLVEAVEPAQCVAKLAGPLEVLLRARLEHRLPDLHANVLGFPLEKIENILHHPAVVPFGLPPDARCEAPADVIVETGPVAASRSGCHRYSFAPYTDAG